MIRDLCRQFSFGALVGSFLCTCLVGSDGAATARGEEAA
jgi:hypothetical protein